MEIFSPSKAAEELGPVLASSPFIWERVEAARLLGNYDAENQIIQAALLQGLADPEALVRIEVYKALSRRHYDRWELLSISRQIRNALELEEDGSPAWFSGMKALDQLRDYYEACIIDVPRRCL